MYCNGDRNKTGRRRGESLIMGDLLHIIGDMADKIKNNITEQTQQFSWKLTFPKEVAVEGIPTDGIMILNKSLKRLRCEFATYPKENALLISPQTSYKVGQEYFFWLKYKKKEICIAFVVSEDGVMQTYDQKTSMEKLNANYALESKKTAKQKEMADKLEDSKAAKQQTDEPKKGAKPAQEVYDEPDPDLD